MINVKDQVYAALCSTSCENVSDVFPTDWRKLPAIEYLEDANTVYEKTDDEEQTSYLRYTIHVWNNESTSPIALEIDSKIAALGLVRTSCQDIEDPSHLRHKVMRYEGYIDVKTERVYWR